MTTISKETERQIASQPGAAPRGTGGASPAKPSHWILGPWKDFVLFVGTPLLIIPIVALAQLRFTIEEIALVGVLGARGHHLPGMLRAYGDRELFQRFRVRFIVAPIFLLVTCLVFAHTNLKTLGIVFLLWGLWHGLAQVYGFMRIYDGKLGARSTWRARLDMAMCIAWFFGGVFHSPDKVADLLSQFYLGGGPYIAGSTVEFFRYGWDVMTALVTAAFVVYTVVQWLQGEPCSYIKLFVMASSFAFWWFAMVYLKEIILGVAVFEIFHDVQYLSIVWVFNRTRVEKGRPVGSFTRFLFRPSTILMALYVGLVVAYGCLGALEHVFSGEEFKLTLYAIITASAFLHYYYDGFIWKIRDSSTSEGLGMNGEKKAGAILQPPGWLLHGLKWSVFVIPAAWMLIYPRYTHTSELEWKQALANSVPDCARAQESLASELIAQHKDKQALAHFQEAVRLKPNFAEAQAGLGGLLLRQGETSAALPHLEEAVRLKPDYAEAHNNLGTALAQDGKLAEAREHFAAALRSKPNYPMASDNLHKADDLLKQQIEAAAP